MCFLRSLVDVGGLVGSGSSRGLVDTSMAATSSSSHTVFHYDRTWPSARGCVYTFG